MDAIEIADGDGAAPVARSEIVTAADQFQRVTPACARIAHYRATYRARARPNPTSSVLTQRRGARGERRGSTMIPHSSLRALRPPRLCENLIEGGSSCVLPGFTAAAGVAVAVR
jgi:hypothetical protein